MTTIRQIYCVACEKNVPARLTTGEEIYGKRNIVYVEHPYWICDTCKNYVGCHHKTKNPTNPLGCIPTPELRKLRKQIHDVLDPLWRGQPSKRQQLYNKISDFINRRYHTAGTRSVDEALKVLSFVQKLSEEKGKPK